MNDAIVTVIGFLAAEPMHRITASGASFMSMRVGSSVRRYDREAGVFREETPSYFTVNCWRALAENLSLCDLKRGDPVVVTGRLRIREYEKDGALRHSTEVEAVTLGFDLSRGVAHFQRVMRSGAASTEDRQEANDVNDQWLEEIGQGRSREPGADAAEDSAEDSGERAGATGEPAGEEAGAMA
jgi:single-strand DNA-binding protein